MTRIDTFKQDYIEEDELVKQELHLPEMPIVKKAVEAHMRALRRLVDRKAIETQEQ